MPAGIAFDRLPGLDAGDDRRALERRHERLAIHVPSNRKSVQREDRRCDIEQARTVDQRVPFHARPFHREHAVGPVLVGGTRRFVGQILRSQVVRVETMIRDDHDRGVIARELDHRAEHHVVKLVCAVHHVLVSLVVVGRDPVETGRVVLHESMAEVIDAVVVHRHEIPGLQLHHRGRGGVNARSLRQYLGNLPEARILFLIDLRGVRNERKDLLRFQFRRVDPKFLQRLGQSWRMDGTGPHGPGLAKGSDGLLVMVRDHHPADGLGRMRGPPSDDVGALATLVEDVPDRLGPSSKIGYRSDGAGARIRLGESVDAMLVRALARGDRRPEHRRENRLERRKVAHDAVAHQPSEVRHLAGIEQRRDDLPIGSVPADQQNLARVRRRRHSDDADDSDLEDRKRKHEAIGSCLHQSPPAMKRKQRASCGRARPVHPPHRVRATSMPPWTAPELERAHSACRCTPTRGS